MEKTTHREYKIWERWLQNEWNRPSRTDNYLMQIAQRILQARFPKQKFPLDREEIKFTFYDKKMALQKAKDKANKAARARWFGWLGVGKK